LDLTQAATTANAVVPTDPFLALIDEARVLCGMSQKEMALNAGVNFGTFSAAMNGTHGKNFSVAWLDAQPFDYRAALARIVAKKFGISKEQQRQIVLDRLFAIIHELVALTVVSE
jgi:DNA-binding XRE family transcriptional regulator